MAIHSPWKQYTSDYISQDHPFTGSAGYHFSPLLRGTIDELGGNFIGNNITVRLYQDGIDDGPIAEAVVDCQGGWCYAPINPVSVEIGEVYTVAAFFTGTGGSYQNLSTNLPQNGQAIRFIASTYNETLSPSDDRPVNHVYDKMYGVADFKYNPN